MCGVASQRQVHHASRAPSRLLFRLIRVRSRAPASEREAAPAQVMDDADRMRTHHGVLKIRKVGCSTPPLATSEQRKRSSVMICLGLGLTSCPLRLLTLADMARRKQARKDVTGIRIAETHIRCGSIAMGP